MNELTRQRLFGLADAFEHRVTVIVTAGLVAALVLTPLIIFVLTKAGKVDDAHRRELVTRYKSWLVLAPLMIGPVLLGAAATIAAVCLLSLLCYREYARATGLFREKRISFIVVLGILAIMFAVVDHWYAMFVAVIPLTNIIIAATGISSDRPSGYIQRVAVGIFGFMLFGACLGHLAFFANDEFYRPILIALLLIVELNDVFAYICGKTFGHRKLLPNTSPNKTVAGAIGAAALTTAVVYGLGMVGLRDTPLGHPIPLLGLGIIISVGGQLGDLMLSSIKRDLGLKDIGVTIPGHGGLLDRFDSLLLVAPAVFHYVTFFHRSIGEGQPMRILTGS